jgi:hypothetical protein
MVVLHPDGEEEMGACESTSSHGGEGAVIVFFATGIPTLLFVGYEGGPAVYEEAIMAGLIVGTSGAVIYYLSQNDWNIFEAAGSGVLGAIEGVFCGVFNSV